VVNEKRAQKRVQKRATVNTLGWGVSTLFRFLFASFILFHALWVLISFLQMFKKDWGDFFWIL
jgi:uncharacterized membrane protein YgaE (UPF0421/DUF939 family)